MAENKNDRVGTEPVEIRNSSDALIRYSEKLASNPNPQTQADSSPIKPTNSGSGNSKIAANPQDQTGNKK